MREFIALNSTETCETLNITTRHLHAILYRARLGLRECLENRLNSAGHLPKWLTYFPKALPQQIAKTCFLFGQR